jgi:threonine dehydratase
VTVTVADVRAAAAALRGSIVETPCLHSRTLSEITGCELYLKFENLQFTASFKERGALCRLLALTPEQRRAGVIAASAGNHAQGVAYHAKRLGIPAVVVMPRHTPNVKVDRTESHGAEIVLYGDGFDAAKERMVRLAAERGLQVIHPYDDERIIAGQGTVALEMLASAPDLDTLIVPVGGGGLIAGMAIAANAIKPGIEMIGVQARRFPSAYAALKREPQSCGQSTIADGIAVREPGQLTLAVMRDMVRDMVLIDEGDIEQAILLLLEVEKTVVEGAGAAGLAAVLSDPPRFRGRKVGLVLSGGNVAPLLLAEIIERGMVRAGRLARFSVALRDLPGALAEVTAILAECNANIEEVHHQRAFTTLPAQAAEVEFVVQTRNHAHAVMLIDRLRAAGYSATLNPGVRDA